MRKILTVALPIHVPVHCSYALISGYPDTASPAHVQVASRRVMETAMIWMNVALAPTAVPRAEVLVLTHTVPINVCAQLVTQAEAVPVCACQCILYSCVIAGPGGNHTHSSQTLT